MNKLLAAALAASTAVGVAVPAFAATPAAATSSCAVSWGSGAKTVTHGQLGEVVGLRAGRHACFDRLVLDDTRRLGATVRYVTAVHQDGSGFLVPLKGGAFLEIVAIGQAYRRLPAPNVTSYKTFRQVADAGSYEGYTTVGLGVRARLPFRVLTVGPDLVVDVAHHW